jgi:hypothetical protein
LIAAGGHLRRVAARNIRRGRVLAQLQRADIRHDVPAIARRDLRTVVRHPAEAVRHDVEEIPRLGLPQPVAVIRLRLRVSALHDEPVACAGRTVARRAEDVEAFLPRSSTPCVTGKGSSLTSIAPFFPVKKAASVWSVPRAIVPSTSGRALDVFSKNALARSGRYFG